MTILDQIHRSAARHAQLWNDIASLDRVLSQHANAQSRLEDLRQRLLSAHDEVEALRQTVKRHRDNCLNRRHSGLIRFGSIITGRGAPLEDTIAEKEE